MSDSKFSPAVILKELKGLEFCFWKKSWQPLKSTSALIIGRMVKNYCCKKSKHAKRPSGHVITATCFFVNSMTNSQFPGSSIDWLMKVLCQICHFEFFCSLPLHLQLINCMISASITCVTQFLKPKRYLWASELIHSHCIRLMPVTLNMAHQCCTISLGRLD